MKPLKGLVMIGCLMFVLAGCAGNQASSPRETTPVAVRQTQETSVESNEIPQDNLQTAAPSETREGNSMELTEEAKNVAASEEKILIAYFSRVDENYGVGVIEKGNTEIIAEMIADETGGELFHIERDTPYPANYSECTNEAKEEQNNKARPALLSDHSIEEYDIIYLGYPIWLAYHNLIQCTQA